MADSIPYFPSFCILEKAVFVQKSWQLASAVGPLQVSCSCAGMLAPAERSMPYAIALSLCNYHLVSAVRLCSMVILYHFPSLETTWTSRDGSNLQPFCLLLKRRPCSLCWYLKSPTNRSNLASLSEGQSLDEHSDCRAVVATPWPRTRPQESLSVMQPTLKGTNENKGLFLENYLS